MNNEKSLMRLWQERGGYFMLLLRGEHIESGRRYKGRRVRKILQ